MKLKTGVIGLGNIGNGVAKNLSKSGYEVVGYDVNPERLKEEGIHPVNGADEIASMCDLVMVAVASLEAYRETISNICNRPRTGLIVGDLCTFPEKIKEEMRRELDENGCSLLDCPVSGARPESQAGELAMIVSGPKTSFDQVENALNSFCRSVIYVGEFGTSIKIKYILNLMIAIHNLTCAEGFVMARKAGIDLDLFINVVRNSAAHLKIFDTRSDVWKSGDYENNITAALAIQLKDKLIIEDFAQKLGVPTPLFDVAGSYYDQADKRGWKDKDAAIILRLLEETADIPRN